MMPNSGIKFISSEGVFLASFVVISFIAMDVVVGVVVVCVDAADAAAAVGAPGERP